MAASAAAQVVPNEVTISSFNPADAVAPASTVEGDGVQVGEGTVIRPVLGVETGYISNVFYEENRPVGGGVLRLLAQVGLGSLGPGRLNPASTVERDEEQANNGSFQYRADLRLAYDLLFSNNNTVSDTGGLGIGAAVRGIVNPDGRVAFSFQDDFTRLIRAANFETDANVNRDINNLRLTLSYQPRDHNINGYLYYDNIIDVFERSGQKFADRMTNRVGLHPYWRVLPQTQVYMDASFANVTALDSGAIKSDSYPLVIRAGLATLLSLKTTVQIDGGYTNGFYSRGPSFSAPVIGAEIGYRYSPLGRATVGYTLAYSDSINANYFRDHIIRASVQQIIKPVVFMIQPEVHFRQYNGVTQEVPGIMGSDTRTDLIFALTGGVHYQFRNWFTATLNYQLSVVNTDYRYMLDGVTEDPSFVRHEVLLGVRAAL